MRGEDRREKKGVQTLSTIAMQAKLPSQQTHVPTANTVQAQIYIYMYNYSASLPVLLTQKDFSYNWSNRNLHIGVGFIRN